jgi:hypothetical protein
MPRFRRYYPGYVFFLLCGCRAVWMLFTGETD